MLQDVKHLHFCKSLLIVIGSEQSIWLYINGLITHRPALAAAASSHITRRKGWSSSFLTGLLATGNTKDHWLCL